VQMCIVFDLLVVVVVVVVVLVVKPWGQEL
jgi:hypothetical protein